MPKTPPLILPNAISGNWFNNNANHSEKEQPTYQNIDEFQLLNEDISSFSYSPSDDDDTEENNEYVDNNKDTRKTQQSSQKSYPHQQENNDHDTNMETLYHHPASSQRSNNINHTSSQQYQLVEDDEEDQTGADNNNDYPMNTQGTQNEVDGHSFDSAVDGMTDLQSEFRMYTGEYKEFKRYVDNAKRELLAYIQDRSEYFEQRGNYLNHKWESLKEFI